jgi:hypothetical protein
MRLTARIMVAILLILIANEISAAQDPLVRWDSFNQGFGGNQTGNTLIKSVVGQGFIGTARSSNTQIVSGFLGFVLSEGTVVAINDKEELPTTYALEQNYPNPFNPTTVIGCQLPVAGMVKLVMYDLLGREVTVLVDEHKEPGKYKFTFDAKGLASGMYIYRMTAGEFTAVKKMVLVK